MIYNKMEINFFPSSEYAYKNIESPKPAKISIPKWYKDIKNINGLNIKSCIPFLDSFSSGYIQSTWHDILVEIKDGDLLIKTVDGKPFVNKRDRSDIPVDDSFHKIEFTWERHWAVSLPEGYSGLIIHPLNRVDLPFYTLSGIVDFDTYYHSRIGNLPFYLKKNFTGIIPKGTPMYQIIPIKRNDWIAKEEKYDGVESYKRDKVRASAPHSYKKLFWQKKIFN